jgi:hypothetical protein
MPASLPALPELSKLRNYVRIRFQAPVRNANTLNLHRRRFPAGRRGSCQDRGSCSLIAAVATRAISRFIRPSVVFGGARLIMGGCISLPFAWKGRFFLVGMVCADELPAGRKHRDRDAGMVSGSGHVETGGSAGRPSLWVAGAADRELKFEHGRSKLTS